MNILAEEPDENIRQEEGYIPEMSIFEKYSTLGGVN